MHLWIVALAHKTPADKRGRKDHYVQRRLVMAESREAAVVAALTDTLRSMIVGYRVEDLGDQTVHVLPSSRLSRSDITAARQEGSPDWTFITDENDEPAREPFRFEGPLRL